MSITLDLPLERERTLSEEAPENSLSLPEYVLHILSMNCSKKITSPSNGAELVAYWQQEGLIGYRSGTGDTANYARVLRKRAEKRADLA